MLQITIDVQQIKSLTKFINLRMLLESANMYNQTNFIQWYMLELKDDYIPPMTIDLQNYLGGGFVGK